MSPRRHSSPSPTSQPPAGRRRVLHRAAAASALGASVALAGFATAAPAQAASPTTCRVTTKSFNLPGKPDVTVSASICARYTGSWGGYRHYRAWLGRVEWTGDAWWIGGKRFSDFSFYVKAHHGSKSIGTCNYVCDVQDLHTEINSRNDGA
ncbi:hypothetical protein ACIQU6_32820 [Streptomyces sp. NPDC090442]|uniref:hypothetical protein n=1 Tax=Streptomyces sp. NPDC090442 TaxID=3365962 RepID=UPI00382A3465